MQNHLKALKDKGYEIDLGMQEYLKLNTLNIWERTDEQINFLLEILGKSGGEKTALSFTYGKFIDKLLLNRNSSVCQTLLRKPQAQVPSGCELHKKMKEIADCAVAIFQICQIKRSWLVNQQSIGLLISEKLPDLRAKYQVELGEMKK